MMGARFLSRLPSLLSHPLGTGEARRILVSRFERREQVFMDTVCKAIFDNRGSPYLRLFRNAGCERGDFIRLVASEGIEGALAIAFRAGVYLSVDEFKGRRDVVRGSLTFATSPDHFRNPLADFHLPVRSGGSRSSGTPVMIDLAFVRGCGVNASLVLEARGGLDWLKATWESPGAGARFRLLKYSSFGAPPSGWFSQLDPGDPSIDPIFRLSERAMYWGSLACGVRLPRPQYAPLDDPLPVVRWMRGTLDRGLVPHLFTFPSSALRMSEAAVQAGIDLAGAQLTLGGEPVTHARLNGIARSGAFASPRYGSMECGPIGYGCISPSADDDTHLQHDLHGLIHPREIDAGFPADALFITALHPRSPFTFFNVSMGDRATLSMRECGCALQHLGWATHVSGIRSFEKLTAGGVTFFDTDVIRVLEEELPGLFGGSAGDYQLIERESQDGAPALTLVIHPRVGELDDRKVIDSFLRAIGRDSPITETMSMLWKKSSFVGVQRSAPIGTKAGKVLHLHSERQLAT